MHTWSPHSWLQYPCQQAIVYPNQPAFTDVLEQLSQRPPLVTDDEITQLKQAIANAGRGNAFLLQGGDCAESFADCNVASVSNKLNLLLQMSSTLTKGLQKPIVQIGRIAGQYAKPRSAEYETIQGITLPSYRGDLVNAPDFTPLARTPDPNRLLIGYASAAKTRDWIRQLTGSESIEFFTSHEALHLPYEQALTRRLADGLWYNTSTHLPWLGMRTAEPNNAHVEYLRGIQNPVGIKIGPHVTPKWLIKLLQTLNPNQEEGRILLISRMGVAHINTKLPPLIQALQSQRMPVTWSCDPMHGNTALTPAGLKTRHFDAIWCELQQAIRIHHALQSHLGGLHLELTGEPVTECMGGPRELKASDLHRTYRSLVDPRLNDEQSLELAIRFSCLFHKIATAEHTL